MKFIKQFILKSKINAGFFLLLIFIVGCEKSENPYIKSANQKESIVFNAESRSEKFCWHVDSASHELSIDNWGLDPLYIPTESNSKHETNYQTLEYYISTTGINNNSVDSILQNYYSNQIITISRVNELVNSFNSQIDSFLNLQKQRLDGRIIDKKHYDQILTDCGETFSELFRQEYYKANIRSSSSIELYKALSSIEKAISAKEWDRLILNIEN
jgi:hypothetical protein